MEILIGKQGNQPFPLTEPSISRQHAIFHMNQATGVMTLRDCNSTNGTWILTKEGKFIRLNNETVVGLDTLVRLGAKQTFRVKELLTPVKPASSPKQEESVDISRLRYIYDAYNQNKISLEAESSNIMMWRITSVSLGGVIAFILSQMIPDDFAGNKATGDLIKILGSVIAIAFSWIIVSVKSKGLIRRKDQNERNFRKKYCCPKCGYHFGTKLYDNILAEGKCPNSNCRCKFTGK